MIPDRIILTGKNSSFPSARGVVLGVYADGTVVRAAITHRPGQVTCPECRGYGEIEYSDINPSVRDVAERCERCRGDGVVEVSA